MTTLNRFIEVIHPCGREGIMLNTAHIVHVEPHHAKGSLIMMAGGIKLVTPTEYITIFEELQ